MEEKEGLARVRREAAEQGYSVRSVVPSLFPDDDSGLTCVLDLWNPSNQHHPYIQVFTSPDGPPSPDEVRQVRQAAGDRGVPFVAVVGKRNALHVYLTRGSGAGFLPFLPATANGKMPTKLRQCQPFIEIIELRRCVNRLADVIFAAHGHDRLRLFDSLLVLLAAKIYDEVGNPENLVFPSLAILRDTELMGKFAELSGTALRYMGCDPGFFRIDLGPASLRDAVRELAPYSFRLTIDLGTQAEVLGTFYQDVVTSTFRGSLGAYFTPKPVADIAAALSEVRPDDTIFDISCGSGTFLTSAFRAAARDGEGPQVFGSDIQERMVLTSTINGLLHGIAEPHIIHSDGLKVDLAAWRRTTKAVPKDGFTLIVANPPFAGFEVADAVAQKPDDGGQRGAGARVHKIIPFIEKIVHLLAPGGRAALVVPTSVLNAEAASFRKLRAMLAETGQVTAVVNLPANAFTHTDCGVAGALLFFRKAPKKGWINGGKTFFARLESVGYDRRGQPMKTTAPADLVGLYHRRDYAAGNWIDTDRLYTFDRWDVPWIEGCVNGLLDFDGDAFVTLTEICEPVKRTVTSRSLATDKTYTCFEVGDADIDTGEITRTFEMTSAEVLAKNRLRLQVRAGDILLPNHRDSLVCKTASGIGRSAVLIGPEQDGYIASNRFTVLRPKIDPEVCLALLNSAKLREQLVLHARGSASFDIREKVLAEVRVPKSILKAAKAHAEIKRLAKEARGLRERLEETTQQLRQAADRLMLA